MYYTDRNSTSEGQKNEIISDRYWPNEKIGNIYRNIKANEEFGLKRVRVDHALWIYVINNNNNNNIGMF